MNKLKKRIVQIIKDTDIDSSALFGDLVFENCFDKFALLITNQGDISVLCSKNNAKESRSVLYKISFIVSILDELSSNNSIICIPHSDKPDSFPSLYFKDKTIISLNGGWKDSYDIGNSLSLSIDSDKNTCSINNSKAPILSGEIINQIHLSNRINHYLSAYIYPTAALQRYIRNGYKTNEELGIHYSKVAVLIAVAIACASPIASVLVSNRIGKATIKEEQFKVLSEKTVIVDTILHQREPIFTLKQIETSNSVPNKIDKKKN